MQAVRSAATEQTPERLQLLQSVAEQLKVPLTVIARQTELALLNGRAPSVTESRSMFSALQIQSDMALRLLDGYLLGLQLADGQTELALEPVSVAALLADTAHELHALARQYGTSLEVNVAGRYEPVMAHASGLRAALTSVSYGFIEACATSEGKHRLTLAVHRTPHGIVAGCYGNFETLAAEHWRRALELCGRARQALPSFSASTGAGLFVAETLCSAMETSLRVGRFRKQTGLAATFQPSRQLQLL